MRRCSLRSDACRCSATSAVSLRSGRSELATQASPAPKVFTAENGFETYSSTFFIDWQDRPGSRHTLELTPHVYRGLRGPYNRRNVYGAAIAYAPVLTRNPRAGRCLSGPHHGFCGRAPLLTELGIPGDSSSIRCASD